MTRPQTGLSPLTSGADFGSPTGASFQLPLDLRLWLGEDRLLGLVIERAAHHAPLSGGARGIQEGESSFPTAQLLALLGFCYLTGRLGSVEIEDCLETDEALRYLCAGRFPPSPVLRRFRRVHREALGGLLEDVLSLAIRERVSQPWFTGTRPDPKVSAGGRDPRVAALSEREAASRLTRALLADTMALDV